MPEQPQIGILPYGHRKQFFWLLVLIFIIALPSLIFYTTGYRVSFQDEEASIVTTGGMYVTTDNLEVDVYIDEKQVDKPRLFRSAYYIQNIEAGKHRVVVQSEGLQTWVKELSVDPYIVSEAAAFNMPVLPHIRPIPRYEFTNGTGVFITTTSSSSLFQNATTTTLFTTARVASSTLLENEEFDFVASLFSTSTATSTSVFERLRAEIERFRFSTSSSETATTATSTIIDTYVEEGNMRIVERENDLYATWLGSISSIPHYFCVTNETASTTIERYGEHVSAQVEVARLSTTTPLILDGNRSCRPAIKLDRKRQDVYFYDFFPGTNDLVLLHLEDGLYVGEIDDRAWQNTQQLYAGRDFQVAVSGTSIFIKEGPLYFEILTQIEPN